MLNLIGPNNAYSISDDAIKHILNGDISERQDRDDSGNVTLTKVISGGLHTIEAWKNFQSSRPDIKHGLCRTQLRCIFNAAFINVKVNPSIS